MDEKIYIDANGDEWTETQLIENLDIYNKDSKTETTITFEEFLGKNPSLKLKETKVTETEVNDKKSKRISQLESKVKGWEPDNTISYDQLPMMDNRSAMYSDYKELERLKTDQIKTEKNFSASLLSSFLNFNASKEDLDVSVEFQSFENLSIERDSDRYQYVYPSFLISKTLDTIFNEYGSFNYQASGFQKKSSTNISETSFKNDLNFLSKGSNPITSLILPKL